MSGLPSAFEPSTRLLSLQDILPTRAVTDQVRRSSRYQAIEASIREIGVIEPLVVYREPQGRVRQAHLLLDGHIRLDVLKSFGEQQALCLLSLEDEGFTYNRQVSRITPVQEHNMLKRAIEKGVALEKIARALNIDEARLRQRSRLLNGITPEAIEALKDRMVPPAIFSTLRRMKPLRQMEAVELMIAANQFRVSYAKALLAATKPDELVNPSREKKFKGISPESIARMESEMESVHRDYKLMEDRYGSLMLNLVVARGYFARLLNNERLLGYLREQHPDLLPELQRIVAETDPSTVR
jgi:ParB-like chromosome segregation protein Spo0J